MKKFYIIEYDRKGGMRSMQTTNRQQFDEWKTEAMNDVLLIPGTINFWIENK